MDDKHMSNDIALIKAQAEIRLRELEAQAEAKQVASKFIGKWGMPLIVFLVCVGVVSAKMLDSDALTPVIGLVATASMALIQMLSGITGSTVKEEKPEFKIMHDLISRLDKAEQPMSVTVEGDRVTVVKGADKIVTQKE